MAKFKHITLEERMVIEHMRFVEKKTLQQIGDKIGKSKSAISVELKRNKMEDDKYIPAISEDKYKDRLHQEGFCKIDANKEMFNYIVDRLKKNKWSPDVISAKMMEDIGLSVSSETIYNYIYNSDKAKSLSLYKLLPSKRSCRIQHGSRKKKVLIPNRTSIHQRKAIAGQRKEIGHFEADLTFNKGNRSMNIGAIIDKKSQKAFLCLNGSKKARTVTANLANRIKDIPDNLRKTFTMDNGKEFVGHMTYRLMGFKTYFCDPYSPGQKGLVEKINSMIHRIFSKKADITKLTRRKLKKIEDLLNNMPRKILGYKTPNEVWEENMVFCSN